VNFIPYWESLHTHTHALHEFSWRLKNFCLQGNLCSLITGLFFICLRIFDELSDCFVRFRYMYVLISCWRPNLVRFSYFCFGYGFSLYYVYPLSFCDKKGEYFLFLDREYISKPVKFFLSQNGQRGSLLVFYVGYILDDKNTLCNGCFLTELSVLFRVFK